MNTWQTLTDAYAAYKNHPGGRHAGWCRMMTRSTYTVDPTEPSMDSLDEERAALKAAAVAAAQAYIAECANGVTHANQVRYSFPGLLPW